MYLPLKKYFIDAGFTVRGEVLGCDLVAIKNGELVIVELKTTFSLSLVMQGNERKRLSENVFLAIPLPKNTRTPRWGKILRLCRALGLGLLTVSSFGLVQRHGNPITSAPAKSAIKRKLLLTELLGRSDDYNLGGVRGRPLVTVYREKALAVADFISAGPRSLADIRAETGIADAGPVLQKNHYGWFQRLERGVYSLSPLGREALIKYAAVITVVRNRSKGK